METRDFTEPVNIVKQLIEDKFKLLKKSEIQTTIEEVESCSHTTSTESSGNDDLIDSFYSQIVYLIKINNKKQKLKFGINQANHYTIQYLRELVIIPWNLTFKTFVPCNMVQKDYLCLSDTFLDLTLFFFYQM